MLRRHPVTLPSVSRIGSTPSATSASTTSIRKKPASHPGGGEDALGHVVAVRTSRRPFDHQAEQDVAAVAVPAPSPGAKLGARWTKFASICSVSVTEKFGVDPEVLVLLTCFLVGVVPDSDVCEEVIRRHVGRDLGARQAEVVGDRRVEGERPGFDLLQRRDGGEQP